MDSEGTLVSGPICPFCKKPGELFTGEKFYPHRKDLHDLRIWACERCDTRVGCFDGTDIPKGSMASHELRKARMEAHRAFDPIWKEGLISRTEAYALLAQRLGMRVEDCHFGQMGPKACREAATEALWLHRELLKEKGKFNGSSSDEGLEET
jgi:hypothetical protein